MGRLSAIVVSLLISGCGISSGIIKSEAVNFGDVIEDTTNKLLVMNLLRARDKAPLHFADIPVVRQSMQQSFSFNIVQFLGSRFPTNTTDNYFAGAGIQFTPSFEINHLHSKEFITGISSPIDPKVVKYWLDRGLDRRIVLLLFFSAVEVVYIPSETAPASTIRISNAPRDAADIIKRRTQAFDGPDALRCDIQSDFERYLKLFNTLKTFFATSYRERRLLARGIKPGDPHDSRNLQAFASLDQSRVQIVLERETATYSLYALSNEQRIAFCFFDDTQASEGAAVQFEAIDAGATRTDRKGCSQSIIDAESDDPLQRRRGSRPVFFTGPAIRSAPSSYCNIFNLFTGSVPPTAASAGDYPRIELRLYMRSVGEMFQFLGDLLYYQDEVRRFVDANPQLRLKLNSPVTFGYCSDHAEPGCDNVFLRLDGDACNARFAVNYRDRVYYVSNLNPGTGGDGACPLAPAPRDHTLEVLGVLHQLVGLNRSASDIRPTPAVQVLP